MWLMSSKAKKDCEMHVVNLAMGYGLGVKENKKTVKAADE